MWNHDALTFSEVFVNESVNRTHGSARVEVRPIKALRLKMTPHKNTDLAPAHILLTRVQPHFLHGESFVSRFFKMDHQTSLQGVENDH